MVYKTLQLNLASAKDLNKVNLFSKMQVYAVVSISGNLFNNQKTKTPLDREGGTNPAWNFSVNLAFSEVLAHHNHLTLEINLRCSGSHANDKDIGSVQVPLGELLKQAGDGKTFQHVSYKVRKPSGKPKGSVNFSYKITEKVIVTGNPSPTVGSTSSTHPVVYPPPQSPSYTEYQKTPASYFYPPQNRNVYPPPDAVPVATKHIIFSVILALLVT